MADEEEKLSDEDLYIKAIEDYEKQLETQQDISTPSQYEKDSQFKFLRELLDTDDSKKIANLTFEELGSLNQSVRGCLKVSAFSHLLGLDIYSEYYKKKAEIIAATSMSRYQKGNNFLGLIFTQIRKHLSGSEPHPEKKSFFFGKKDNR